MRQRRDRALSESDCLVQSAVVFLSHDESNAGADVHAPPLGADEVAPVEEDIPRDVRVDDLQEAEALIDTAVHDPIADQHHHGELSTDHLEEPARLLSQLCPVSP